MTNDYNDCAPCVRTTEKVDIFLKKLTVVFLKKLTFS